MHRKNKGSSQAKAASIFHSVELFSDLPEEVIQKLEQESGTAELRQGHVFFRTGEAGHGMFVLEKGLVRTYRTFGAKKLIIAELEGPAVFGEMGCIGGGTYHCVAEATKAVKVRVISRASVDELLNQSPELTRKLLELVSQRYVNTLLELETSSFRQLIPRLARLLLERANGEAVSGITHKEIAERLRVYRETATSALGELKKAGIIEVKRKVIHVLDRRRLERAAQEGVRGVAR